MKGIKQFLYTSLIVLITSCWWASFALDWGDYGRIRLIPLLIAACGSFVLLFNAVIWLENNWNK